MTPVIDEKDKQIIDVLLQNSSLTTRQIAKKTLIPITTVNNRIRKLKNEKIISKYTIEPDWERIDKGFKVHILITANLPMLKQLKRTQHDIAKDLKKFEFTEKVDIVSGGTDLVATIRVKDVKEFDTVLLGKIQNIEGIEKTQSLIVIKEE